MKKQDNKGAYAVTVEAVILDGIQFARDNMKEVVSINVPRKMQGGLLDLMIGSTGKLKEPWMKIKTLYGYPVKDSDELSISIKL